jgi:hypothetical protein
MMTHTSEKAQMNAAEYRRYASLAMNGSIMSVVVAVSLQSRQNNRKHSASQNREKLMSASLSISRSVVGSIQRRYNASNIPAPTHIAIAALPVKTKTSSIGQTENVLSDAVCCPMNT